MSNARKALAELVALDKARRDYSMTGHMPIQGYAARCEKAYAAARAQIEVAEKAVIDSLPKSLLAHMEKANAEFAAKGGCPGCDSKTIAVHYMPCSECDKHPFD